MYRYEFLTTWRVASEPGRVWDAVSRSSLWPAWWRGVKSVRELERGGVDGGGNVQRFVWRGALPYRMTMDIRTDRVEPLSLIQATAFGDVEGTGAWRFEHRDAMTVVRYEWRVDAKAGWLRALSGVARPLFIWNHKKIMEWGALGLAERLGTACTVEEGRPRG